MSRYRGNRSYRYEGDAPNPLLAGLMFLGILAVIGIAGWLLWIHSRSQAIQTPLAVGAGFDVSQSMSKEQKQRSVMFLDMLIDEVLPAHTPTKIWRYAETVETVHAGNPIASDDLNKVSHDTIENFLGKWGTRPDKVMQEFQRYARQHPEHKIVLCLFTDGECHAAQQTREQAARLAQNDRIVAVVIGPVITRYRQAVENDHYAPLQEAGKLFVFGETDALDVLTHLKERLRMLEN